MTNGNRSEPNGFQTFLDAIDEQESRPSDSKWVRTRIERGIAKRERADGSGTARFDVQVWESGRAVSKTFKGVQEARAWRDQMLGKRASNQRIVRDGSRIRLGEFVEDEWLAWIEQEVVIGSFRRRTGNWYQGGSKHVIRELGDYYLADIGKAELRSMLARRIEAGDSPHMLRWIRATTRSILQLAVERELISTDPSHFMVGRNAPRVLKARSTKVKAWSREEAEQFVSAIQGDRFEALWILLLTTGLRRGEALALTWDDIDFDDSTVSVSKALVQIEGVPTLTKPKTARSARTIAIGPETLRVLKRHRRKQAEERLSSDDWTDTGYVFTTEAGTPLRPDRAYVLFKRTVERCGLPWIRLHGLRHTMASIALRNGTDVATVSERLGHSDTSTTTRIYLHGSPESDRAAASQLDALLDGLA